MTLSAEKIRNLAQKKSRYFTDSFRDKLVALEYPNINSDNIGALYCGIFDLYEGFCMIYKYYLPIIIDKKNFNKDILQDMFIDIHWELDHLKRHIEDIGNELMLISNFLDESNDKKDLKDTKIPKR